ncbi:hypothetical protein [Mucilaginibacter sp.]|uniref:hypothetical protein n=1 Tax=Mucilaginibacter sp. TaxID=1882438 RepID=UPI0025D3FA84|nr:hypothetical protein [Mucilaginibacter sp.]
MPFYEQPFQFSNQIPVSNLEREYFEHLESFSIDNYLVDQKYYTESYNTTKGEPNWVS